MNLDIETRNAYAEVIQVLKYLPKDDIEKIPRELIIALKENQNHNHNFQFNVNVSLKVQNFSKKAKDLIAVIKYNYWSTDEEKQQLQQIFYDNENKYQKELSEKYDLNNIFKKKESKIEMPQIENNVQMVVYKENIFIRIFNKLKNLIKK